MDADPMRPSTTLQLLLIVIPTLINAYFAVSEMTIISASKNRIHRKVEEGNHKAIFVGKLLQEPTSFLSTIQVAITLVDLFNSASAATGISVHLGAVLGAWVTPYGEMISIVVITILLSFTTLISGELVPRQITLQNAEVYSMFCVKPILIIPEIVSPFIRILSWSTRFILRLFSVKGEDVEESLSREEIRFVVESGQESGVFDEGEADVIDSVSAFGDILVEEVMTPGPGIFCIDIDGPQSKCLDELMEMCYNRIPVYRDSIDNIIGILDIKDSVVEARKSDFEHVDISRILHKSSSVLESKNIDDLSREIQSKYQHITILIDEYGGFSGTIAMKDLVEEVMGDTEDEYDEGDKAQIEKLDEHMYVLDGGIPVDNINGKLGLQSENDNHETISGFLPDLIEQIPEDGKEREVIWNHIKSQVKEVKYKRIHRVQLVLMQGEEGSEEV